MHAVGVARELGIKTILVPPSPGVLCAMGMLTMDVRTDAVKTVILPARDDSLPILFSTLQEMIGQAHQWLTSQGFGVENSEIQVVLDMRYKGQNYELQVQDCHPTDKGGLDTAIDEFHRVHKRAYGYCKLERPVEIINIRVTVLHPAYRGTEKIQKDSHPRSSVERQQTTRDVLFDGGKELIKTPVLWRPSLSQREIVPGPVIIESLDSTVVIPPDAKGEVDDLGNLIITG